MNPKLKKLQNTWAYVIFGVGILLLIILFLGYLGEYFRFCDVLSNFKEQIFLAGVMLLLMSLLFKKIKKLNIAVSGLIIISSLFEILPWYYQQGQANTTVKTFRVALINVLKKNDSYDDTIEFVKDISPDILVFMEIDEKWLNKLVALDNDYKNKIISSKLGNDGIVLYSKLPIIKYEEISLTPKGRPNFKITFEFNGQQFDCLIAHPVSPTRKEGKWEDRNIHIKNLGELANSAKNPVIIIADLNTSMWSPFYKSLIEETKLQNARRGFGIHGTYPAPFALISGIPIDHILFDENFSCQNFKTGPHIGSDHLPIWADISMK